MAVMDEVGAVPTGAVTSKTTSITAEMDGEGAVVAAGGGTTAMGISEEGAGAGAVEAAVTSEGDAAVEVEEEEEDFMTATTGAEVLCRRIAQGRSPTRRS